MARYGVIDLGSNSVRLVVYEVRDPKGGRVSKKDFSVLLDMKKMAGLSAYVADGVFSDEGIKKAAYIVSRHLVRAANVGCDRVEVFATAVLRNCANSKEAVARIEESAGCAIWLLSGEQEARLDFVGASCEHAMESGTLIDIGGGSTELVAIAKGKPRRCLSLDQGSVSSYAQFVKMVLPTPKEQARIAKALAVRLKALPDAGDLQSPVLYGVGGSVRAVAKMKGAREGSLKVPKRVSFQDVEELAAFLADDPAAFVHAASRAVPDRLHTVGCGLAMVKLLMETFGAERLEVCRYGVREGFLIDTMLGKPGGKGR